MRTPMTWDDDADQLLIELVEPSGRRWKLIIQQLDGFTESECKNRWLAHYDRPSFAGKVAEELPDGSRFVFQPAALHAPNETAELPELSFNEFKEEVIDHALVTSVRWQRFNNKYQQIQIALPEFEGNPRCPEFFEAQYQAVDGPELFLLVRALLTNGFLGTSLAEMFGLSREQMKLAEVAAIVSEIGVGQFLPRLMSCCQQLRQTIRHRLLFEISGSCANCRELRRSWTFLKSSRFRFRYNSSSGRSR
jgi:hypothetical protein